MNRAGALLRWSAILLLWALIAVLAIPTMTAHWLAAAGLHLIELLAATANRMRKP